MKKFLAFLDGLTILVLFLNGCVGMIVRNYTQASASFLCAITLDLLSKELK